MPLQGTSPGADIATTISFRIVVWLNGRLLLRSTKIALTTVLAATFFPTRLPKCCIEAARVLCKVHCMVRCALAVWRLLVRRASRHCLG